MIVPDTNLLIYAYDAGSPFHAKAKTWWENLLADGKPAIGSWVGLSDPYAVEMMADIGFD